MIFCLFGTNPYQFTRLALAIDKIAEKLSQQVLVQSGSTTYSFSHCQSVSFLPHDKLMEKLKDCSLVICQGGYGSITEAIKLNKPTIAIPRYPYFNESADEQSETVQYFYEEGLIEACFEELESLSSKVDRLLSGEIKLKCYSDYLSSKDEPAISDLIQEYLLLINRNR